MNEWIDESSKEAKKNMRKIGDGKTKSPEFIVCVVVREKDEEKL